MRPADLHSGLPSPLIELPPGRVALDARAYFLGERIDLRALDGGQRMPLTPAILSAGQGSIVVFRYGAVVFFNLEEAEQEAWLVRLRPLVSEPYGRPETEDAEIALDPMRDEQVLHGVVVLRELSPERVQIVADILAKSAVLSHYETGIAEAFDRIEPLAATLRREGRGGRGDKELLRHIGGALLIEHRMVWRVEVGEKPEILWDMPELERLYQRLADEYELRERQLALERKLALIAKTAETLLDLLQHQRSLRVEWYIVILILVAILIMVYELL
jgi:uncharacterized Rmd1/YagE family protein